MPAKPLQITLVDLSLGAPDALVARARDQRLALMHSIGSGLASDLILNVYGFTDTVHCASSGFVGGLASDCALPGIHRVAVQESGLIITIKTGRVGQPLSDLAAELCVRADAVLVESLEACSRTVLAGLTHEDGVVIERVSGRVLPVRGESRYESPESLNAKGMHCDHAWTSTEGAVAVRGHVAVVGAGIAGFTLADELSRRGFTVTLLDSTDPLGTQGVHSGHLAAALTPVVSADDNVRSRLSRAGALAANRLWSGLSDVIGKRCGALQLQKPSGARRQVELAKVAQALDLPQWARAVDSQEAADLAGCKLDRGGLWMPGGWVIHVPALLRALSERARVTVQVARVSRVESAAGKWLVRGVDNEVLAHGDAVVLANAGDVASVLSRSELGLTDRGNDPGLRRLQAMHRLAGEVTLIPAHVIGNGPRCIVGGDGYVLPSINGWCVAGGTYVRGAQQAQVTQGGRLENLQRVASLLNLPHLMNTGGTALGELSRWPGWAGWRAVVPGRLPVVGPVGGTPGLFVCTGGASRGLTWSALQAELLGDLMQARAPALERVLLTNIASNFL